MRAHGEWAAQLRNQVITRGASLGSRLAKTPDESLAWAMYRIMVEFPGYILADFLVDGFTTPQFFQLCELIRRADKEKERQQKKSQQKKGK